MLYPANSKAVKRRSAVVGIEFDQPSLSFEFIFSLYDLTSSSIETAIRGREKDDKTSVASYQDQMLARPNSMDWK